MYWCFELFDGFLKTSSVGFESQLQFGVIAQAQWAVGGLAWKLAMPSLAIVSQFQDMLFLSSQVQVKFQFQLCCAVVTSISISIVSKTKQLHFWVTLVASSHWCQGQWSLWGGGVYVGGGTATPQMAREGGHPGFGKRPWLGGWIAMGMMAVKHNMKFDVLPLSFLESIQIAKFIERV